MNLILSLWVCCPELNSGESGLHQSAPDLQCTGADLAECLEKKCKATLNYFGHCLAFQTFSFADPPIQQLQLVTISSRFIIQML